MNSVGVGVGCFIRKQGKILVGVRVKEQILSLPGGHLEFSESFEQAGLREIREECGEELIVQYKRFSKPDGVLWVSNDFMPSYNKHYITAWIVFDWISGEPKNAEPHKCEGWEWKDYDEVLASMAKKEEQYQWMPLEFLNEMKSQIFGS